MTAELTKSAKTKAKEPTQSTQGDVRDIMHTDDVVLVSPQVDVDGVQNTKEREAPRDTIDNGLLASWEELVDDSTWPKKMSVSMALEKGKGTEPRRRMWMMDQIKKAQGAGVM